MIVLNLFFMFMFVFVFGYLLLSLFHLDKNKNLLVPVIGYSVAQILFYLSYIIFSSANIAFGIVVVLFIFLLIFKWSEIYNSIKNIQINVYDFRFLLVIFVFLLSFSWTYLYFGFNSFWLTASGDAFDALNGRDYYFNLYTDMQQYTIGHYAEFPWLKDMLTHMEKEFVYANIAIQYSSVVFWSIFLNAYNGFDAFILQMTLNLLIGFIGIYLLINYLFKISNKLSLFYAFVISISHFYIGTYFNSHEGSLIFGSIMPFLLYSLLKYEEIKEKFYLYLSFILVMLLLLTYPHPLVFFIVPYLLFYFRTNLFNVIKKNKKIFISLLILILILSTIIMSVIYNKYTVLALSTYRSWGISFEPEMILLYWGLLQSNLTNGITINSLIFSNIGYLWIFYIISILFSLVALFGFIKLKNKYVYFSYFAISYVFWFLFLKYIIADSYYFYKFLYTTQFVVLLFFIYGLISLNSSRNKILTYFSKLIIFVFMLFNILMTTISNKVISEMKFNTKFEDYEKITAIDKEILRNSYLDIPIRSYREIIDKHLRNIGIYFEFNINSAKYIITLKDVPNLYHNNEFMKKHKIVYEDDSIRILENSNTETISIFGGNEVEVSKENVGAFQNKPFIWLGNGMRSHMFISGITDKKFMQICGETNRGVNYGLVPIVIENKSGQLKSIFQGVMCQTIDMHDISENNKFAFTYKANVIGNKFLPFDDRELNLRIGLLNLTNEKFDIENLFFLNPKNDVANQNFEKENNILIGNSWYPQELVNMRWGSNNVELLVLNTTKDNLKIEFDLEPGPSLQTLPLKIEIFNQQNEKIGYLETDKREKLVVKLPVQVDEKYQIFKLKVLNDTKKLKFDPRDLNFRVFSIKAVD